MTSVLGKPWCSHEISSFQKKPVGPQLVICLFTACILTMYTVQHGIKLLYMSDNVKDFPGWPDPQELWLAIMVADRRVGQDRLAEAGRLV